ncbi:MAG: cupin domain-containing protein [Gemmatimonadota bacterium]|nr:cupin domain-containing protein [Gemmatimonadota bacterium]
MSNEANPVPVSSETAEHYAWGVGCDGWHLLRTPTLSVITERMEPDAAEVSHRHVRAQQFFFVLNGELALAFGGRRHRVAARHGLHVPAGVVHQVLNVSDAAVDFLVISEPPSHGDRELVAMEVPGAQDN